MTRRNDRRQQILEVLAGELEAGPGTKITTAGLARAVGVSEAALYRHFASKAKMYEALIEFAEDSVFGLTRRILDEEATATRRLELICTLVLGFAERNPGIARMLLGDVLTGENERLRERVAQFFARLETQLKQVLRDARLAERELATVPPAPVAGVLLSVLVGKLDQFVRSGFERRPLDGWETQWEMLLAGLLATAQRGGAS